MHEWLLNTLIFPFPYFYIRLSAVEKVSFFSNSINKSMVIFYFGW